MYVPRHRENPGYSSQSDLDGATGGAMHLSPHAELATQEVDITELEGCGFCEPQPRERAHRDEDDEALVRHEGR
jgi:hypothetical protein